jgi:hypothetical protein
LRKSVMAGTIGLQVPTSDSDLRSQVEQKV